MLFDADFLIRFSGQRGRKQKERAERFLGANPDTPLYISRVAWAEFAEGCEQIDLVHQALTRFTVIEVNEPVAWEASRISRILDRQGRPIGDNDVWIAATAKAYGLRLVTANDRHFSRITFLDLATY